MKSYVSLFARLGSRFPARARIFSTSTPLRRNEPFAYTVEAKSYVASFYKATRDPVWLLVDTLHTTTAELQLDAALAESSIHPHDFRAWKSVVDSQDIDAAISRLEGNLEVPEWVLLCLVTFKVKTAAQAEGPLLELVFANKTTADMQGPILVLTAFHLARHNMLVPLPRVVDAFLALSLTSPERPYNRLLTALASAPLRSPHITNLIISVMKAMDTRNIRVFINTYTKLLGDRLVTIQLAKFIKDKMQRDMMRPEPEHLEALHRAFSRFGEAKTAAKYFAALHASAGISTPEGEDTMDWVHRANTTQLANSNKRETASKLLNTLDTLPSRQRKAELDIYDQTTALHVLANDLTVSTRKLISEFAKIQGMPTIATYTVLVRGFLLRQEYSLAEQFWVKVIRAGWPMDRHTLTAGIQALTRNGKPRMAFTVLEKFALKPGEEDTGPKLSKIAPPPTDLDGNPTQLNGAKVIITTVTMNEIMVSFNRIGRPDVVFRLWDYMETLYDVRPDSHTLSILLQAARLAMAKGDSLSGVLDKLKRYNPFSGRSDTSHAEPPSPAEARAAAVAAIEEVLGDADNAAYRSGVWRDMEPFDLGRTIFLQAFFGNHTERVDKLLALEAPARAWRMGPEDEAYEASAYGLGLPKWRDPIAYKFEPPPGVLPTTGGQGGGAVKTPYPTIVVTNSNCFHYISLLGAGGRVPEIPYVLAWMRYAGLVPSDATLALAMVFFREVTVQAPLVEKWAEYNAAKSAKSEKADGDGDGGLDKDEYRKLRRWIVDWVGKERLPDKPMLAKWQHIANRMRMPAR